MLALEDLLQLGRAADGALGEHVSPTVKEMSIALSHKADRRRGALTLEHLLQLGLAANGGAAGGRAACSHGDRNGHNIVTASSRAAG